MSGVQRKTGRRNSNARARGGPIFPLFARPASCSRAPLPLSLLTPDTRPRRLSDAFMVGRRVGFCVARLRGGSRGTVQGVGGGRPPPPPPPPQHGVLWEMRKWRTLSATRTTSSQSLRYPYSVILGADQKDRSLWERDCFSRSVYENLQVRFLHSPIHLLYIQQFHSILHKSYQTNKPWTRTTRSNTYNLGPERTVKRRNQRRLNEYRSK